MEDKQPFDLRALGDAGLQRETPTPPASRGVTSETTGQRIVREWEVAHRFVAGHDGVLDPIAGVDLTARIDAALDEQLPLINDRTRSEAQRLLGKPDAIEGEHGARAPVYHAEEVRRCVESLLAQLDTLRTERDTARVERDGLEDTLNRASDLTGIVGVAHPMDLVAQVMALRTECTAAKGDRDTAHARLAAVRTVVEPVAGYDPHWGQPATPNLAARILALLDGAGEDGK